MNKELELYYAMKAFCGTIGSKYYVPKDKLDKLKRMRLKDCKDHLPDWQSMIDSEFAHDGDRQTVVIDKDTANKHEALYIDYNSIYGGYVVNKMINGSSGIDCPFSHTRQKYDTFIGMLRFYCSVTAYVNRRK